MKFITKGIFTSIGTLFLALCLSILLLISCKSPLQASQQEQIRPLLEFQKTACLGPCPAYLATINSDGSVIFVGHEHVPSTDTLFFKLPAEMLDSLKADIAALNYTTLKDLYPTQWSDMPSTYMTFYKDGKEEKRIKVMEGGPEALQQFYNNLDRLLLIMAETEARNNLPVR